MTIRNPNDRWTLAGFTLVELAMSAAVLSIFATGLVAVVSRGFNVLRASQADSAAALALEQRVDQFARATWTEATCNYPPLDDADPDDVADGASEDPDEPYTTDYDTEITDLDTAPGVVELLSVQCDPLAGLNGVTETITIVPYPTPGAKFITATRTGTNVSATTSSGADDYRFISYEKAIEVTFRISWVSRGRTKSLATKTVIAKGS